ncbi:hypothetical protein DAEQUDRAFT_100774 [Daedalea quercina L-15889]|uniref:Uncharacterized protein n=1 Tax=Daedalea quercina L-15889 TaxID=1314783 RepID=A0A165KWS0_9APHY|nr:hypothetical protein DAEQUDRAFT_100774 [Daedalea quercina L-15889]
MMLPRLLPSSATDGESDSDSLASPLDSHFPIAHVNIARRSSYRLLDSPIRELSRPQEQFDNVHGSYVPYVVTNTFGDTPYEAGCTQTSYFSNAGLQRRVGEPQSLPNLSHGLYGLAPYPATQDDSHQYSAASDTVIRDQTWGYLPDSDYASDSPTSAVSEPFFPQHERGEYIHGFQAQYATATVDLDSGERHSSNANYSLPCGSHGGDYSASTDADILRNFAAQQEPMSGGGNGSDIFTIMPVPHNHTQVVARI